MKLGGKNLVARAKIKFGKPFFDPTKYWSKQGHIVLDSDLREQREIIMKHVSKLEFNSVFEVGVGEARLTEPILRSKKIERYDGCDINPTRLNVTKDKLKDFDQFNCELKEFELVDKKDKNYDLVMAIEVLMHIPPSDIKNTIEKMIKYSKKYVINADATIYNKLPYISNHCFVHDFEKIYSSLGYNAQCIKLNDIGNILFIVQTN